MGLHMEERVNRDKYSWRVGPTCLGAVSRLHTSLVTVLQVVSVAPVKQVGDDDWRKQP